MSKIGYHERHNIGAHSGTEYMREYMRLYRDRVCCIERCEKRAIGGRGMCKLHYNYVLRQERAQ